MNFLRHLYKGLMLLSLPLLYSCSADEGLDIPGQGDAPEQLELTLSVPDATVVELGTRAATPSISSVTVFCYDRNGQGLSTKTYTSIGGNATDGFTLTAGLHRKTAQLQIVANASIADKADGVAAAPNILPTSSASIMWGKAAVSDLVNNGTKITLIRDHAQVSVVGSGVSGFTYEGFGVAGTASSTTMAPADAVYVANTDSIRITPAYVAGEAFAFVTPESGVNTAAKTIFETKANTGNANFGNCARIIIKGKYKGKSYYYPVAFRKRSGSGNSENPGQISYGENMALLRNHHYIVKVLEVRGEGWTSYADAQKAVPENRVTVLITDRDNAVSNLTSDRDNMLGVSGDQTVGYNTPVTVTLLTSYATGVKPVFSVANTSTDGWVLPATPTETHVSAVVNTSAGNKNGVKYTYTLRPTANEVSNQPRTATVYVTVGNLKTSFKLTQKGCDFLREDTDRKIQLTGLGTTITDYFNQFVDQTCQGLKPEQNRGAIRNQGLHFPAVDLYTATYKIPVKNGDQSATITGGTADFQVSKSGNYYIVTVKKAGPSIATGNLRIVANNGSTTIDIPLYRTGIFHELKSTTTSLQSSTAGVKTGYFYYEVVKVGNAYILDRNLGASSNAAYVQTYAPTSANTDAIGAYFKIATTKSSNVNSPQTIKNSLNIGRFNIPTKAQVEAWDVTMTSLNGSQISSTKVAAIATTASKVANGVVYIPHGGYYDDVEAMYPNNANIWTRSLVSGAQGFSSDSPDFGYWYIFFNGSGSQANFSNLRFCNGLRGETPTATSAYRYIPLRLIWE